MQSQQTNKKTYAIICKCCGEILRRKIEEFNGVNDLANNISLRHLNNYVTTDRCKYSHEASRFLLAYDVRELSSIELDKINYQEYMNGSNYN